MAIVKPATRSGQSELRVLQQRPRIDAEAQAVTSEMEKQRDQLNIINSQIDEIEPHPNSDQDARSEELKAAHGSQRSTPQQRQTNEGLYTTSG